MRPLKSDEVRQDLVNKAPVLLLDTTKFALRYLIRQVEVGKMPGNLPTELWYDIIDISTAIAEPRYEAVRPIAFSSSEHEQILHCRGIILHWGDLGCKHMVRSADKFLQSLSFYEQMSQEKRLELASSRVSTEGPVNEDNDFLHPSDKPCHDADDKIRLSTEDTDTTYAIDFPRDTTSNAPTPALHLPDCLFTAVTVPEVIAWLKDGRCWVCNGERSICPGCTGGIASLFDAFMGCGVDLACPLCLGLSFMEEDKDYCEDYYEVDPPSDVKAARMARLRSRWAELGYRGVGFRQDPDGRKGGADSLRQDGTFGS
ncbi:MAG: hypothetical protein L6R39_000397 [Caloplaca ligustica]|nr:MAG: hypothetical protein L6R39_000397 [Caloplaca ligustica]